MSLTTRPGMKCLENMMHVMDICVRYPGQNFIRKKNVIVHIRIEFVTTMVQYVRPLLFFVHSQYNTDNCEGISYQETEPRKAYFPFFLIFIVNTKLRISRLNAGFCFLCKWRGFGVHDK